MAFRLEMLGGLDPGRKIPVWVDRPRVFRIVRQGLDAGVVEVSIIDGMCVVQNSSLRPVLVNGVECQVATLSEGDLLRIGKDEFRIRWDADEEVTCFLCNACCLPQESWSDGQDHLCAICLASGSVPVTPPSDEIEVVDPLASSGRPPRPISERRRRAISATMPVQIASKPGLLTRLSGVFRQRHRRHREELLRQERRELLEEIGRLTLSGALFGLEENQIAALQSGRGLQVAPESQSRKSLERWRELRERANLIEAEITVIRRQLGLGPDPDITVLARCELRAGVKGREDRVYAAMDAMETQDYLPAVEEPTRLVQA